MAGFSPAARSRRATSAATGVLPRPPIAKLPMLTTGARRDISDMMTAGSDTPERTNDSTRAGQRQNPGNGLQGAILRSAVGLDERPRRGAQARTLNRVAHEA